MATQILEGTWEDIAAHAVDLAGKRLRVEVELDEVEMTNLVTEIPVVGPPNEGMLAALREIEKRQKGRRQTFGDSVKIIRHGRTGPLYGMEYVDDLGMDTRDN